MSVTPVHVTVHPVAHAEVVTPQATPVSAQPAPTSASAASTTNVKDDGHDVANQTLTLPGFLGPILLKN